MSNILIINDSVGTGNIASSAMMPILSYMGFSLSNLPTSLVSNNFGYGKYALLDTTNYLRETFCIWEQLGFEFGAIATGFIPTAEQADLVSHFCHGQASKGVSIFVDPVMGDDGAMYEGLSEQTLIASMRKMLTVADYCYPNYTEACLLTGTTYKKAGVSKSEAEELIVKIREIGAKSVLITSIKVDGVPAVVGYNAATQANFMLAYEELPMSFSGTGDVFSAILIAHILNGDSLEVSTQKAIDGVYNFMRLNKDTLDPYKGLPIEKYLGIL